MRKKRVRRNDKEWLLTVTILAFTISVIMGFFGELILGNVGLAVSMLVTFIFILLGIIFDVIGVAVTAADIHIFNSMASKKVKGANVAVRLINNASRVSSVCCDVVGDVCGVASGSAGVAIAAIIIKTTNKSPLLISIVVTAVISMLTIGGKALGKSYAIRQSTDIVHSTGKIISKFMK